MIFKVGDVVTVRKDELKFWLEVLEHKETSFTVASFTWADLPCCVGHSQSLVMTNGEHYSGAWFDHDLDGKPKQWCHGNHYGESDDYWEYQRLDDAEFESL